MCKDGVVESKIKLVLSRILQMISVSNVVGPDDDKKSEHNDKDKPDGGLDSWKKNDGNHDDAGLMPRPQQEEAGKRKYKQIWNCMARAIEFEKSTPYSGLINLCYELNILTMFKCLDSIIFNNLTGIHLKSNERTIKNNYNYNYNSIGSYLNDMNSNRDTLPSQWELELSKGSFWDTLEQCDWKHVETQWRQAFIIENMNKLIETLNFLNNEMDQRVIGSIKDDLYFKVDRLAMVKKSKENLKEGIIAIPAVSENDLNEIAKNLVNWYSDKENVNKQGKLQLMIQDCFENVDFGYNLGKLVIDELTVNKDDNKNLMNKMVIFKERKLVEHFDYYSPAKFIVNRKEKFYKQIKFFENRVIMELELCLNQQFIFTICIAPNETCKT